MQVQIAIAFSQTPADRQISVALLGVKATPELGAYANQPPSESTRRRFTVAASTAKTNPVAITTTVRC